MLDSGLVRKFFAWCWIFIVAPLVSVLANPVLAAPVAEVNGVSYDTCAKAFEAIPKDGTQTTLKLLEDIDLGTGYITVFAGQNVIFDMNGKKLTSANKSYGTISVAGEILIYDGVIESTAKYAVQLTADTARVTLEGGTLKTKTNSNGAVYGSKGTFRMTGGTIDAAGTGVTAKMVEISGGTITAQKGQAVCAAGTISGGTISSGANSAVYANQGGTLEITGGTLNASSAKPAVQVNSGNVKVTEGAKLSPEIVGFASNASAIILAGTAEKYLPSSADLAIYDGETLVGLFTSASTATSCSAMNGKTVKLMKDITTSTGVSVIGYDMTLDLNGHDITSTGITAINCKNASLASKPRKVTITGEGTVSCNNGGGCIAVNIGKWNNVTIESGTYKVGGDADNSCVYIENSTTASPTTVTIAGGSFESGDGKWVLNINDKARTEGGATMSVTGGTFKDFDPSNNNAEGAGTNFLPADKKAVHHDDGTYTVEDLVVAKIGEQGYPTLEAALAAAKPGETVKLVDDIATTEQVVIDKSVTLDLAGHVISYAGATTLAGGVIGVKRGGALTIEDSSGEKTGKIDAGKNAYAAVTLTQKGDDDTKIAALTLNSGTLSGYYYGIAGNGSRHGTEITINGGTVEGTCENDNQGIYHPQEGTLTINGGTVTGYSSAVEMRAGTLNVTGGTLTATADHVATNPNGSGSTSMGAAVAIAQHTTKKPINVSISGGELSGFAAVYESNPNKTDATDKISLSITGGNFTTTGGGTVPVYSEDCSHFISGAGEKLPIFNQPITEELCAPGFEPDDDGDGHYTVTPMAEVCRVNGVGFWSLQLAIAAAQANGYPVEVIDDIMLTEQVVVDGSVTIDLDGHTIAYSGEKTLTSGVIGIKRGGSLTIEDSTADEDGSDGLGKIDAGTNAYAAVALTLKGEPAEGETAALTVNGGTLSGYYYGVVGNGSRHGTEITINGGTVEGTCQNDNQGIYHPQDGTLTINGGTVTGYSSAVEMRAGTLNVTGGTLTATADHVATNPNGSGSTSMGAAVAIAQHTTKKPIDVSISGGELSGFAAVYESNPNKTDATDQITISITDGTFTATNGGTVPVYSEDCTQFISGGSFSAAVPPELCDEAYEPTLQLEDGRYGVKEKEHVCRIGEIGYWSIGAAIKASKDGETITLIKDLTEPGFTVPADKSIVFDTGDFTYTLTAPIKVEGVLAINHAMVDVADGNADLFETTGAGVVAVAGGSYAVPVKAQFCDDAYEPTAFEDGRFGVKEKEHVCKIGDKGYWSIEAALKAANPFDTIVVITDIPNEVVLGRGHVTLDLNGHEIKSVRVDGAVVTVVDSKGTGLIGGPDVDTAITVEAGKIFVKSGRVLAKEKALAVLQNKQGELIEVNISGGTFEAPYVIYQENVNKLPSSAVENIVMDVTGGTFAGAVWAEDKRAFIEGGTFDPAPEKKYGKDDLKAELPSVTVTTELDIVNPYDFKISLREAFLYAQQDGHNALSEEGGYKISFNWQAIQEDAASRGVEATGVFDMSAAPFEATSALYDETTGRSKFIMINGALDLGDDSMINEGDRMAIIRGLDFHTKDTRAQVRAVVVDQDPADIIERVPEIEDPVVARLVGAAPVVRAQPTAYAEEDDEDTGEAVCELNGDLYTSLSQALAAVPADGTPATIKLVADLTGKGVTIPAGKNVTLDLGGYLYLEEDRAISVAQGATFTLANGRVMSLKADALVESAGDLTLRDVTFDATDTANVKNAIAAYCGTLTVTGNTAIKASDSGSALRVTYGLDELFDAGVTVRFDDAFTGSLTGPIAYGAAERVEGTSWQGSAKIEIRGSGRFDTTFDAALDSNIRIYSGTFNEPEAVPVEFQAVPLDGLYWQIVREVEGELVTNKYATLPEAYATVDGNGVNVRITQLFDQTGRGLVIDGNKNVTIDFNGKTYTVAGSVNSNFIIDGKREVVELVGGTLRTTAPGNLISNKGTLTIRDMNIDLRGTEIDPGFRNIISATYGQVTVTGDTILGAQSEEAVLAVTAQRNDDWNYDDVKVVFDEDFTGKVVGQIRYGESAGTTKDMSWLDAARVEIYSGRFDIKLTDTSTVAKSAVENLRLYGGTFTERSQVGERAIGDFAYTEVDIDWELRMSYVRFYNSSFDLIGRNVRMLVDACWFEGNSALRPDWILEADSTGKTSLQFLNSVIHRAKGAIFVNEISRGSNEVGGYVLLADSTIGETTGDAAIMVNNPSVDTYLANVTFYGNEGKSVKTEGHTRAVNVLAQKNGENLPSDNIEVMTSIYQEEYADEEIFRMDAEDPTKPHFYFRWLRDGYPVDEAQEGAWSLTPAYHLNDESVAGGNCRFVKLAKDNDGYVEAITTALKQNGTYSVFAGEVSESSVLHALYHDQLFTNLDRGQPSKGAFWIPVDEPSLVVTTIRDTVNPTDLEISLREAINYAKYLATEDTNTISTITFDWDALDEEYDALRKNGMIGTGEGKLSDYTMYLGCSIDWVRRSDSGDCHLMQGRSAASPIAITAEELPQGLVINANRNGSVRPYFCVDGSLWGEVEVPVAFDLGDGAKVKFDHFQVSNIDGAGIQLGKNANLYLSNSCAVDGCVDAIVGDEGSTVVLERASVSNNSRTGITATNVSAQNTVIDGGTYALKATLAQLFNTTVVGGIQAEKVVGVNDIISGAITADEDWFRYSAFDAYPVDKATTNVTHNIGTSNLGLALAQSSRLGYYSFNDALDWGHFGTAVSTSKGYDWSKTGAAMPVYVWGQRTKTGEPLDVETGRGAQALPDTWAAYRVGEDDPYSDELKGAILNDVLTNTRNPHEGQLSMGAWQAQTIVAWKTLATDGLTTTDHATDFSRIDLNTYYSTLQDAVDALAQNAQKGDKNVQFEGKDAVFLVSYTLTNTALGDELKTVVSKGDVAIVGNSYYYSGIKTTGDADAALIVSNGCSVAIANVGFVDSKADAIKVYGNGDVTLYRSAINGNDGDGVNFTDGATGSLLMFNTTVANNKGVGVRLQSGTAEIYDSTIVGNRQGLAGHGDFYLANSIVLKNTEGNEDHVNVRGGAYNVMSANELTADQLDAVFYRNSLSPWYRMVRVNYTGAAGWMGTKVGRDADNNWYYLDRGNPKEDSLEVSEWVWRSVKNNNEASQPSQIITSDQQGTSRLLAENAGFHEYAVGAYVPEMELEVEVMDQIYQYNGTAQNPDPAKAIYRIMTGIGKLNQGRQLYYNAADGLFYSEFAYVTNRTTDVIGVAPSAWGEPTVSKPRDDLNNAPAGSKFQFSADILPIQAGNKINVLHQDVPGASLKNGFPIDKDGYYYLDGYPFYVTDVVLKKGTTDLTESYKVIYPQSEDRDYAKMILTPRSVSLSRAFEQTKEYDGTQSVIMTQESLEHAGVLFGEVTISPGSKFEYQDANVLDGYAGMMNPDGTINKDLVPPLTAEDLGLIGTPTAMGNYYITTESQNYTSLVVPKKIKVTLDEIEKKIYDGEATELTFDFTDPRIIYTATNTNKVETYTLAEALVLPTRRIEGKLTVCQESELDGVVTTNTTQIFRKDVGDYPFFIVCEELHVYDSVDTTDKDGNPKDFARNYNFEFADCEAVFTVIPRKVTLPISVNDRIYDGMATVAPAEAISHEPIATGVKDEAFVINSVGMGNAKYASAHVKGNGEVQAVTIADPFKIDLTGENGAETNNYAITFSASGAILKRELTIENIYGVETKFYDGTTGVVVDTEDLSSYSFVEATETTGLVGAETVKLTGRGHITNIDVGSRDQQVIWDTLTLINGTGLANDYDLQPYTGTKKDPQVVIEQRPIIFAYTSAKIYDGTLALADLDLTATTTNRAGKVTKLTVDKLGRTEIGWTYRIHTGVVNENTKTEELFTVVIADAVFTYREVNTFSGDPKEIVVVDEKDVTYVADELTGAKLSNYEFTMPETGKGSITRRTITFRCADRTMVYGGMKPKLTDEGSVILVNPSDLAEGDEIRVLTCRFGTTIKKSSSGEFQKGTYADGITRGTVEIAHDTALMNRNYDIKFLNGKLQVGPGTLQMVLDGSLFVKPYDGTTSAEPNYAAITLKDLVKDPKTGAIDEVTVEGMFTYDTKDVVKGEDGMYTNKVITFVRTAVGGKDAMNYDWAKDDAGNVIVVVTGDGASILPREATVNVSVADKDYDSTLVATPVAYAFDNLVSGEAFNLAMGGVTAAFDDKHKGEGKHVTVALNADLDTLITSANDKSLTSNYAFAFDPNTAASIRGIPLTVMARPQTMTYGDTNPDLTDQWQHGIVDGDSSLASPNDKTYVGDTITVILAYADKLETSTSGNFTAKTHENAIALKTCVVIDNGGDDVTDSYEITYESSELMVAPRTLTVSVDGTQARKTYDGNAEVLVAQQNHALGNNIAGDVVDVTGAFAYNTKDVRTADRIIYSNLALTGIDAVNYTLGDVVSVEGLGATIYPLPTKVAIWASDKVYNGDKSATPASVHFDPLIGDERFMLDLDQINGAFDNRHVGERKTVVWNAYTDSLIKPVAGTGADADNYIFNHEMTTFASVTRKSATIAFAAKDKVYDATTKAERTDAPFVFTGLIERNEDGVTEAFSLDDSAMSYVFGDKNVGEGKTVTASGYSDFYVTSASVGGMSLPEDYDFTFNATAVANITKKPMTISYTTENKVYDATPEATRDEFTYDGLCENDDVMLDDDAMEYYFVDVNGIANTGKDVGVDKTVRTDDFAEKGVMKGVDVGNYSYALTPISSATISRKPVSLVLPLVEKIYDGTTDYAPAVMKMVPEMAGTEVLMATAYGVFTDKIHNETVTDYFQATALTIEATEGADFGNYALTYAKDRTVELEAGTTSFTISGDQSFLTDGRINRRPITITANDQAMIYGEDNPDLNTAITGGENCDWAITMGEKVATDTVTAMLAYGTIPKSTSQNYKAGNHTGAIVKGSVTIKDDGVRDVTDSYAITFTTGMLVVNRRNLSMTLNGSDFTKVYDGNTSAKQTTHALVNNVVGDVIDIKGTYNYNSKNVTEAETVTATGLSITGTDAANYMLTEMSYTSTDGATITPRPTVITVKPENKIYDGTADTKAKIESFSNLVAGESFNLDKTELVATFAQSDVGTAVEVTYVGYKQEQVSPGSSTRLDNYSFEFTNKAVGDITKRPSTITWKANDKQYDAKIRAEVTPGSFEFGNLVDGEGFTMNESGFTYAFADKNVGTAKPVTAIPNGTLEANISSNGGAAKVSNYAFTLTKTAPADITPAPLTITFTTKDKIYDATPIATRDAFQYTPLLIDDYDVTDDVTLDDFEMRYVFVDVGDIENTGKNAAANKLVKTVEGKGYDVSYLRGKDKDNYKVVFTDESTATINKMELRLDLPKADKVYDATTALREETLVKTVLGAGDETFTATALGAYKDTHANDYDTYVMVTDLTIVGANGAVFGNYVISYAGHGTEEVRKQTETGTYDNATFQTTESFGTPGRITALGFTVATINQTMTYGDSYPVINGDGEHWGQGKVWSLPGTQLATGDRIWVTLKWNASIPTSTAGYYTADAHEGALVVDKIVIQRTDGTEVTASYKPTFQSATLTVNPRLLTVTVDGKNFSKVYDGNRSTEEGDRAYTVDEAVVDAGTGKFVADAVTVEGVYTYNDKDVADASYVIFSEQELTGVDAANYTLDGVTSVDSSTGATITRRASEITVATTGKTYDGNMTANMIATYAFSNLVPKNESDVKEDFILAIVDFVGTFNTKDVETATTVTFTHAGDIKDHIAGADATSLLTNYDFTFVPTAAAKIAQRHVMVAWEAEDKDYDQDTVAEPKLGSFVFTTPVVNMNETQESFTVSDENAKAMTYTFSDKNVGKDKTVTATGWTRDLVTAGTDTLVSNYIFDFVPKAKAEIRPITLTISYMADDKVYDATTNATRTVDFIYTGLINGDVFTLSDAKMYYGFDTKNVGVDKTVTAYGFDPAYLQGADVQNYTVAFMTNALAKVTKKDLMLTLSEAVKTYDGTTDYASTIGQAIPGTEGGEVFTATATGAFNSKLAGSSDTYFKVTKLDIVGTEGADFGNYKITYNGGEIDVAELETTEQTITDDFDTKGTINKKAITVSADAKIVVYGEAYPELTYTGATGITGDTLTVPLAYDEAKIGKSTSSHYKAGVWADAVNTTVAITVSDGAQDVTDCYAITFNTATLTVTQRDLSMTLIGSDFSKVYDGDETADQTTHMLVNAIVDDDVEITGTYMYSSKDVTPIKQVTANALSITGIDAANYQLTAESYTSTEGAIITAKPVAVSAKAQNKTYDATVDATAGMSPVVFTGLIVGESLTYDDVLVGTFASPLVGTSIIVTYTNFSVDHIKADDVKANYSFTIAPSKADISPAEITVTAKGQAMTYGDANRPSIAETDDWMVTGLLKDDSVTVTLGWATLDKLSSSGNLKAGMYEDAVLVASVTVMHDVADATASYVIRTVNGPLMVGKKNITVVLDGSDYSKIYDGNTTVEQNIYHFADGQVVMGDTVTTSGVFAYDEKDANDERIVTYSEIKLSETDDSINYTLTATEAKTDASAKILKKPISVKAQANDKPYDKTNAATSQTVTFDGLVGGEMLSYPMTLKGVFANVNVDTGIVVEWTDFDWSKVTTDEVKKNYSWTLEKSSAAITRKLITITADDQTMAFAAKLPTLESRYSVDGLVDGDAIAGSLAWTTDASHFSKAGFFTVGTHADAILQGTIAIVDAETKDSMDMNYMLNFNNGTLTVEKAILKNLTIGANAVDYPIAMDPEWLDQYVTEAFSHWNEDGGDALTSDAITQNGANGYALWQSYVLGLDPTNPNDKIWVNSEQTANENTILIKYDEQTIKLSSGYRPNYRLDTELKGVACEKGLEEKLVPSFDILISDHTDVTGYYTISCRFTKIDGGAYVGPELTSCNAMGILKVESGLSETIIAVPWTRFTRLGDQDIRLSDLLKTANLAEGDVLHVFDPMKRHYLTWRLTEAKAWDSVRGVMANLATGTDEVTLSPPAQEMTVSRGMGIWLVRADAHRPFYLYGQVPRKSTMTSITAAAARELPEYAILAAPSMEDFDIQCVQPTEGTFIAPTVDSVILFDQIFIPTMTSAPIMYTYRDGKWGYDERYVSAQYGSIKVYKMRRVTTLPKVKAGTGFWYVSRGGAPQIKWSNPPSPQRLATEGGL